MRRFFYPLCFFSFLLSCTNQKRIHIVGTGFPKIDSAEIFVVSSRQKIPIKDGKFDIFLDTIRKGEFVFAIQFPTKEKVVYTRNKMGELKASHSNDIRFVYLKHLYINPGQSKLYYVSSAKSIPEQTIRTAISLFDEKRTDIYRIKLSTQSTDATIYESFDSLKNYYQGLSVYKIQDSLYKASKVADKIHNDFTKQALDVNKLKNYHTYNENKKTLIRKNLDNPVSVLQILNLSKEEFTQDKEYIQLLSSMQGRALNSSYYKQAQLKFITPGNDSILMPGQKFSWPVGVGVDEKPLSHQPSKNKYTLVEFWASWCVPCRQKNPEWNSLANQFKDKGFKILGVSLDEKIGNWRDAIAKDKLYSWLHVSDLENGFNGTNALKYGLQSIPANVLVNSEGLIIKKNIEPKELAEFLSVN